MSRGRRWVPRFVPEQVDSSTGARRRLAKAHSRGDIETVKRLTRELLSAQAKLYGGK